MASFAASSRETPRRDAKTPVGRPNTTPKAKQGLVFRPHVNNDSSLSSKKSESSRDTIGRSLIPFPAQPSAAEAPFVKGTPDGRSSAACGNLERDEVCSDESLSPAFEDSKIPRKCLEEQFSATKNGMAASTSKSFTNQVFEDEAKDTDIVCRVMSDVSQGSCLRLEVNGVALNAYANVSAEKMLQAICTLADAIEQKEDLGQASNSRRSGRRAVQTLLLVAATCFLLLWLAIAMAEQISIQPSRVPFT